MARELERSKLLGLPLQALERTSPKLADALKHASPDKVKEVLAHADPDEMRDVLDAMDELSWWRTHWYWIALSFLALCAAAFAFVQVVRRMWHKQRRSRALLDPVSEIDMWVNAGSRSQETPLEDSSEAAFQQF
mmetsp:Transcript_81730/g.230048  ORF Transcript_81730/g.230048 Transcript_81730/m.230048 type:complete len:134 (-) Transcript_81730:128-529(-)